MASRFEFLNQASQHLALRIYKSEDEFIDQLVREPNQTLSLDHDILRVEGCVIQPDEDPFESNSFQPTFTNRVSEHYPSGARLSITDLFGPRLSSSVKAVIIALASPADPRERNDIFVYDHLIKSGIPRENVQMLLEHQATMEAALAVLRAAVAACAPNDTLFVYIGSHGTIGSDGKYRWVLHDQNLLGEDVASVLRKLPSTVRCLTVVDSCYSGAFIEVARSAFEEVKRDDAPPEEAQLTVLCSVQSDSVAKSGWRLVALLLEALQNECRFSFGAIARYAHPRLKTPLATQKAQLAYFNINSGSPTKITAPVSNGGFEVVNLSHKHVWVRSSLANKMTGFDFGSLSTVKFEAMDHLTGMYWQQGDSEVYVPSMTYNVNNQYPKGAKLVITDLFGPRITASIKALVLAVHPSVDPRLRADRDVYDSLITAGVPSENIHLLMQGQATLKAVLEAFTALERSCVEQDVLFLYLATEKGAESQDDCGLLKLGLADDSLMADVLIEKFMALKSRQVVLCIDACSAGSVIAMLQAHPQLEAAGDSPLGQDQRSLTVLCSASAETQFPCEQQWQFHRVLINQLQTRGSARVSAAELAMRVQQDAQKMPGSVAPQYAVFKIL